MVFDVDGTLLNSCGRMTQRTFDALRACHERGVALYVATARPKRLTLRPEEVPGDVSFLTNKGAFYNGAEALDSELGFERHWMMPAELVRELTAFLADAAPGVDVALQHRELWHSFRLPLRDEEHAEWGFADHELLPFEVARHHDCSKIVAWHGSRELADLHSSVVERFGGRVRAFLTDSRLWLMLVASEATKENAVGELLALRNIPPAEVVVFGDDTPDLGLFQAFPRSVAMGNASNVLKDVAAHVTKSNDEDGVAFALEQMLGPV
jgi:HAD superfamily hydrolase (TIGR01484 family)